MSRSFFNNLNYSNTRQCQFHDLLIDLREANQTLLNKLNKLWFNKYKRKFKYPDLIFRLYNLLCEETFIDIIPLDIIRNDNKITFYNIWRANISFDEYTLFKNKEFMDEIYTYINKVIKLRIQESSLFNFTKKKIFFKYDISKKLVFLNIEFFYKI